MKKKLLQKKNKKTGSHLKQLGFGELKKNKQKQIAATKKSKKDWDGFDNSEKRQNGKNTKGKGKETDQKKKKNDHISQWKNKPQANEEEESDFEEVTMDVKKSVDAVKTGNAMDQVYNSDSEDDETERKNTQKLIQKQNRKNKKSGGFQVMGLSYNMMKGITRKGYKIPTPIQRKTIPIILDGKDVVAMARTGSGKTAAFLIPMFEKLHKHSAQSGARALVLSPTRELAVQTLKFTKELGKFTGLRAAVVLGGDRMDDQFAALHENPDIIIATPGRFMHVVVEMDLKLKSIQYVVFDEADRLFEMGFQEQLTEILNRLPESRQTLLFSATLPKLLVDFAKAGLHDPTLVRLDVETKISQQLKMCFLHCRGNDKLALLIYLLKHVIKEGEQTVVFAATKHHVEYIHMVLEKLDISSTYIYSSLDPTARKINIAKFQHRRANVLVVTDLAARGIDIPLLDNCINYHFPAQPKLFVHRVGRVARAGRSGTAYSLVCPDELAHMLDLHLFIGRPVKYVPLGKTVKDEDDLYGMVPQSVVDDSSEILLQVHKESFDIAAMVKVCKNAFSNYIRSRPAPAQESIKRVKEMKNLGQHAGIHPIFESVNDTVMESERLKVLNALKSYKSNTTIFEINKTAKTSVFSMMKEKRVYHGDIIDRKKKKMEDFQTKVQDAEKTKTDGETETASEIDLQNAFSAVIGGKRRPVDQSDGGTRLTKKQRREMKPVRDEEHYVSYKPADFQSELGLRLGNDFDRDAAGATLEITGEDATTTRQKNNAMRWDRKKKKFIRADSDDPKKKKIRTESGALISASYKSNAYKDWLQKSQHDNTVERDVDESERKQNSRFVVMGTSDFRRRQKQGQGQMDQGDSQGQGRQRNKFKKPRSELKRPEQIMKERKVQAKKQAFQNQREKQNKKNRSIGKQKGKSRK